MLFGTLYPTESGLRDLMDARHVECFTCGCRTRWSFPRAVVRLGVFLRRQRIDILHTHLFEPSVVGLLAARLARTPTRVVTRHYSDYHTRIDKRWHVRVDRLCTRLADAVIGVSAHTAQHLITVERAPAAKVHAILNGIDFERVREPSAATRLRRREELGGGRCYLLLVAARLHPEKGYEHLLAAMARLKGRLDRPVRLLVAGSGPLESHYRGLARDLGCADVVQFLGFREDIVELMTAVDVVVLPSVAEAFGFVLTEAMYLGVPLVATRVGGIPEIVDDGVDGLLVPPADPTALADTIAELLADESRRQKMATAGRAKVVTRFRFETMVRRYEALYDRLQRQR